MGKRKVTFYNHERLPMVRHAHDYLFYYRVVDNELVGGAKEKSSTQEYAIKLGISDALATVWLKQSGITLNDLPKVLFEYGREIVTQKLKDGTLSEYEEVLLVTSTEPEQCPYDPSRIGDPNGQSFIVELSGGTIMNAQGEIALASQIIDVRDTINALFYAKFQERLLHLRDERSLLEMFRPADSKMELSHRSTSLALLSGSINKPVLQSITGITGPEVGSISLLGAFLKQINAENQERAIKILKNINVIRQGYPNHGDQTKNLIEAYRFFGLDYPVPENDCKTAWKTLLSHYLEALRIILEAFKNL